MPRSVNSWVWRRKLRDHGPENPSLLLTLLVISTFMNRQGEAYPGQGLIAKGARCSKRTIQRHLKSACHSGWLKIYLAGREGQAWRHYQYQASVPDWVDLDGVDEDISDAVQALVG